MSIPILLSSTDYNIRSELFSANEQGTYLDPAITESARTWRRNLLTSSNVFSSAVWSKSLTSVANDGGLGPDGLEQLWTLTGAGGGTQAIYNASSISITAGQTYVYSIYIKKGTSQAPRFRVLNNASTASPLDITLNWSGDLPTVSSSSGVIGSVNIEEVSTGLFRLSAAFSSGAETTARFWVYPHNGTTASTLIAGYAQLELGSLTEYQPITDFSTEFKAAFPTHTIYQDSTGVAPVTAPGDLVGLVLDQRQGALSNLGLELWTNPVPTITNNSGTVGAYDSGTLTMTNSGATVAGYPRFTFEIGAVSGRRYKVNGRLAGDLSAIGSIRLASATDAQATCTLNTSTGEFSGLVVASATGLQILTTLTSVQSLTIASLSVREVPGNHAYQSTSGARPTLGRVPFGGRRNLLTRSEEFDNAVWLKNNVNVTANTVTSPSGSMADLCIPTVDNTTHFIRQISLPSNTYTFSCYLKAAGETQVSLWLASASVAGIFTLTGAGSFSGAGGLSAASIEHVGDGWYLCQVWHNVAGTTVHVYGRSGSAYIGNGTDGFYIADAQAEATASLSRTTYQRVGSTHDVTEAGQPDCWYLDTTGSKWMQTNAIDFSATDEMTVIAGVRKLSDAASAAIAELTASVSANNGAFALFAPSGSAAKNAFGSRGSTTVFAETSTASTFAAPLSAVHTGLADISSPSVLYRQNGVEYASSVSSQGSGNYSNSILYVGSRAGASAFFNGHIFSFIIRGKTTEGSKLTGAERLTARKTGITI